MYVTRLPCVVIAFNFDYSAFAPFEINIHSYYVCSPVIKLVLKCKTGAFPTPVVSTCCLCDVVITVCESNQN